jgi:phage protein U
VMLWTATFIAALAVMAVGALAWQAIGRVAWYRWVNRRRVDRRFERLAELDALKAHKARSQL